MDQLKYIFDQVNNWIKVADQKAMILGSFNLAGLAYQLVKFDEVVCGSMYTVALFALSLIATALALIFWLRIIYPSLDNKLKKSKIYFEHIANAYSNDMDTGVQDLQALTEKEFKRDLASQIVINSCIAKKKYGSIQKFIWAFAAQLILLALLFISML